MAALRGKAARLIGEADAILEVTYHTLLLPIGSMHLRGAHLHIYEIS